jgi:hypothetical protein
MIFPFNKMMDRHVDRQFLKDPSGRLVFLPSGGKGKAYFVDSKSDEEKIRAFVRMYRVAGELLSWPTALATYVWIVAFTSAHRWTTVVWIASFFFLLFLLSLWVLWSLYKQTVPSFTSSLTEVGPDLKNQLTEAFPHPRRLRVLALAIVLVGVVFLCGAVLLATQHSPGKSPCPPKSTSTSPVIQR